MKVKLFLGIRELQILTPELTTNWSPKLLASMSLTTGDEWIGINPKRDKEQWDEFFTESELRHTGRYTLYIVCPNIFLKPFIQASVQLLTSQPDTLRYPYH